MIGFELLRPGWAWLFFLALAVLALGAWGVARRKRDAARIVTQSRWRGFLPDFSPLRVGARVVLASLAVLFGVFSVLGPVRGFSMQEVPQRGLDLVICLDTSRSMLARDLRPSRLERAKREVIGLLDRLHGDRVALVAFSGDARDVAPLTHDTVALRSFLEFISPQDNRRGGTDLAMAIEHGLRMFDGRTGSHEAIILLTDGEDLEGQAQELARKASDQGIRIYVVGIGTEGGGKIPLLGPRGRESFLVGPDGVEVVTRLDDVTLRTLSETTGGDYLSAEFTALPLEELYEKRISRLEGRELEGGMQRVPHDRYQWSGLLALGCMLIEVALRERRRRRTR